jgi:DNA-binding XRE family transcriptional regulator
MAAEQDSNLHVVNELIAEAVARPGWSQARLAKALGLRPQTINKWVKGENTPRMETWASIEGALGFAPNTFWRQVVGADAIRVLDPDVFAPETPQMPAALSGVDFDDLTAAELKQLQAALDPIRKRQAKKRR